MEKLGRGIVKARIPILVISILLLIPAALGYINTRVNYDILYYLPKEIDTMQGQDILLDEFQKGAYAIVVVDGMHGRELTKLEDKIENVDHVAKLISYNSIVGGDIPLEMIPEKLRSQFYNSDKDSTMLAIFFDDTTSSDGTMNAIKEIRKVTDGQCFISGMSAVSFRKRDTNLCIDCGYTCLHSIGIVHGFIPCSGILHVKYRYRNCL